MRIIGLTGGIASGKSTAANALRGFGAEIIDADAIARELTAPGGGAADAILRRFGTLDRRALGGIIFSDDQARKDLNAIVHPLVRRAMEEALARSEARVCVLDVPLLFESGMERMADEVWVVYTPLDEQLRRVMERDGLTEAEAMARIQSQMPTEEKVRKADEAIDTSGPMEQTLERLCALYEKARRMAGNS